MHKPAIYPSVNNKTFRAMSDQSANFVLCTDSCTVPVGSKAFPWRWMSFELKTIDIGSIYHRAILLKRHEYSFSILHRRGDDGIIWKDHLNVSDGAF